jgi:putative transposase
MPRRLIPFMPELYYHIYNRGNNREVIFFDSDNYLYFLRKIKEYIVPVADILVYCLMPTHYHLMVRVKQTSEVLKTSEVSGQFSNAMQKFLISYTKAINKRYARVGALFQGAFQAKPITNSSHLLHLCRYIHANPVKDGLVADPASWPYSNYLEWIGERDGTLIDRPFAQSQFPNSQEYQAFVLDYLHTRQLSQDVRKYLDDLEA